MFRLFIAIIGTLVILAQVYSWVTKKQKVEFKSLLLLLVAATTVAGIWAEKVWGVEL